MRQGKTLSPDEQSLLNEWYDAFPEYNDLTFDSFEERNRIKNEMKEAIFTKLQLKIPEPETITRKKFIIPMLVKRVAAAILFIVAAGGAWVYFSKETDKTGIGKELYAEITVPKGGKSKLVYLPDSSEVWLQPGSSIKYPQYFAANKRDVQLIDGAAFFSVKHNENAPFTVATIQGLQVRVLGTVFNVKTGGDNKDVEVSLLSGSVSVRKEDKQLAILKPNEQLKYSGATGTSEVRKINAEKYGQWRHGYIVLDNADLNEVAETLNDFYNVKVSYDKHSLSGYRFNMQCADSLPLTQVMSILKDVSDLNYTIKGNEVTFFK